MSLLHPEHPMTSSHDIARACINQPALPNYQGHLESFNAAHAITMIITWISKRFSLAAVLMFITLFLVAIFHLLKTKHCLHKNEAPCCVAVLSLLVLHGGQVVSRHLKLSLEAAVGCPRLQRVSLGGLNQPHQSQESVLIYRIESTLHNEIELFFLTRARISNWRSLNGHE